MLMQVHLLSLTGMYMKVFMRLFPECFLKPPQKINKAEDNKCPGGNVSPERFKGANPVDAQTKSNANNAQYNGTAHVTNAQRKVIHIVFRLVHWRAFDITIKGR